MFLPMAQRHSGSAKTPPRRLTVRATFRRGFYSDQQFTGLPRNLKPPRGQSVLVLSDNDPLSFIQAAAALGGRPGTTTGEDTTTTTVTLWVELRLCPGIVRKAFKDPHMADGGVARRLTQVEICPRVSHVPSASVPP